MDGKIPAATDTKIMFCRDNMYKPVILGGDFFKQLRGPVCRMIIHNYHIERESAFLAEGTFYRIPYCPDPVEYRNDH